MEEEVSHFLTHKKHEKLKIIRDDGAVVQYETDTDSKIFSSSIFSGLYSFIVLRPIRRIAF